MAVKKANKTGQSSSKKDYTAVLLEDMRDSIKLLAEGQQMFRQEMHRELGEIRDDLHSFKEETRNHFRLLEQTMEGDRKVMIEYLSRIEDEIMDIKATLRGLDERKVDWKDVKDLIKRVEKLEKELAAQRNMIKTK